MTGAAARFRIAQSDSALTITRPKGSALTLFFDGRTVYVSDARGENVAGVRGFHIDGMALADEGTFRRIALTVRGRDSGRCMDNLGRQIDRLFGVRRISNDIIQSEAA